MRGTQTGDVGRVGEVGCRRVFFSVNGAGIDGLTQKRTLAGGGALQVGDLRLLEDGGERGGALVSDAVVSQTTSEGQDGKQ